MSINRHRFAKNNTKRVSFSLSRTLLNSILGGGGPADVKCVGERGGDGGPLQMRSHEIGGHQAPVTAAHWVSPCTLPGEFNEI